MKRITVITMAAIMSVLLCSCGSAKSQSYMYETAVAAAGSMNGNYYAKADYAAAEEIAMEMPEPGVGGYSDSGIISDGKNGTSETGDTSEPDHGRKLIRNINVNMQTLEFDALFEGIKSKVSALGGYIENSSVYNGSYNSYSMRNASITARVPQNRLEEFLNTAFADAVITNMNESTEDITLRYSDIESKVLSLKTEQERLNELLKKAESVEDLITIEERLSEVRYEIESYQSSLKSYDNQVTYSTVWIYIEEVKNITPTVKATFAERIRTGWQKNTAELGENIEDFFVWLITNILEIILTIGIITAAIIILKKLFGCIFRKKDTSDKNRKKKEAKPAKDTIIAAAGIEGAEKNEENKTSEK